MNPRKVVDRSSRPLPPTKHGAHAIKPEQKKEAASSLPLDPEDPLPTDTDTNELQLWQQEDERELTDENNTEE